MNQPKNWLERLKSRVFPATLNHEDVRLMMLNNVADSARMATNGCLDLFASRKPPWFMTEKLPRSWHRLITIWILKKFNPHSEIACARCNFTPLTQAHIAHCSNMLSNYPAHGQVLKRYLPE
jgi:hypothetical protein